MHPSPSFEVLQKNLLRRGLSRAHVHRYAEELADHRDDLILELQQQNLEPTEARRLADERLGSIDQLTKAAIARYQSRTLMGRHPRLFFAAIPFLMVPILFCIIIIAIAIALMASHLFDQGVAPRFHSLCLALFAFFKYGIPAIVGVFYYRSARRRALSTFFRMMTAAAAVIWAAFFSYSVGFESPASTHGHLMIGLSTHPNIIQALAVALPILLYARLLNHFSQKPTLAS